MNFKLKSNYILFFNSFYYTVIVSKFGRIFSKLLQWTERSLKGTNLVPEFDLIFLLSLFHIKRIRFCLNMGVKSYLIYRFSYLYESYKYENKIKKKFNYVI